MSAPEQMTQSVRAASVSAIQIREALSKLAGVAVRCCSQAESNEVAERLTKNADRLLRVRHGERETLKVHGFQPKTGKEIVSLRRKTVRKHKRRRNRKQTIRRRTPPNTTICGKNSTK